MAEPVKDWKSDYDIFDKSYITNPFPVWDEIRASECPVAHTDRWGGSWMPTKYEDLFNIARDIVHYSSRDVLVAPTGPPPEGEELPEDMPANETIELHAALKAELGMPVHTLVVNQLLPRLFQPAERPLVTGIGASIASGSPLHGLALAGRHRALREEVQEQSVAKLAEALPHLPKVSLPMLFLPEFKRDAIESLSRAF